MDGDHYIRGWGGIPSIPYKLINNMKMQNYATSKNYIENQCGTYLHIGPSSIILHLCDPNTETPRTSPEWWERHRFSTCQVQMYSNYLHTPSASGKTLGVPWGSWWLVLPLLEFLLGEMLD